MNNIPSSFSQLAVYSYLTEHDWKHQVGVFRDLPKQGYGQARLSIDLVEDPVRRAGIVLRDVVGDLCKIRPGRSLTGRWPFV